MKLDIFELEKQIVDCIKTFDDTLDYVWDFVDLDTYKKSNECFIQFPNISFQNLTTTCNEQIITANVYFVCRNGKSADLKQKVMAYASKFYNWFYNDRCLGGIVDTGEITDVQVYEAAESNLGIKVIKYNITFQVEI